jgi:hypothetical protein
MQTVDTEESKILKNTNPIHNYMQTVDTEESKILNTNSSSSMINNINFNTTSNGSSLLDEKKYFMKKEQNQNIVNNNNLIVNSQNLGMDKSYTSSIHNANMSYTNSLDQSAHFKNNNYTGAVGPLPRNYNAQFGTYNMCHDNNYFYKNNMPQMYEYKSNPKPQFKMNFNDEKNIIDNLVLIIKDQNGCKLIQKKLEEKNNEFMCKFFDKVNYLIFFF